MASDDIDPSHTDVVDREAHDERPDGVSEDQSVEELEDGCANDSEQDTEEEFLAESKDDDVDLDSIGRAADDGQPSEAGDKAKSPSLRNLTASTVSLQAASSHKSKARQLPKIPITIDCDEIPEPTKVPSKPDMDTVNLADDYTDEEILLGKVAHPRDLHGTIILRLWGNYSREELTQRINWLYEALKMNGVSPSAYSHRFDQALAAKAKREEWSKEQQQEEEDRIKKKQPRGVRAEWVPTFTNRPNIPTPEPKKLHKQTNPRQYGPMKKKGLATDSPTTKQKGKAPVSSGKEPVSVSSLKPPSTPAEKPTTKQKAKAPVSSGKNLVSDSLPRLPFKSAARKVAEHVPEQDQDVTHDNTEPHMTEVENTRPKLSFRELAKQPSRKWTRNPMQFRSFTGSEWSVPSFTAAVTDEGQRRDAQSASSKRITNEAASKVSTAGLNAATMAPGLHLRAVNERERAFPAGTREDEQDLGLRGSK